MISPFGIKIGGGGSAPTPAPVGATLMKSGQTTSYRTGDDGDIQAGRDIDFLTLLDNNPFGNTNRFTDTLGGQTYTDNIVIDWSTYNGSRVLGISKNLTLTGNILWDAAIDYCLTFSAGVYTTGWRLWNYKEFVNFLDLSKQYLFQYSPFDNNNQIFNYWFSNTLATSSTTAWVASGGNSGTIGIALKNGASGRAMPVRTFVWDGTQLI